MYSQELIVKEGVDVGISGNVVKVKGPKGELEKDMKLPKGVKIEKVENNVKVSSDSERRSFKSIVGSTVAHIRNMIDGVTSGYTYRLKVVYSHFPVTVKVEGSKILVQNFLGERNPRIAKIIGKADVKVQGTDITVSGNDIDEVSKTAANIEQSTRITGRDRRVFQDGCWITSKGE